MTKVEDVHIKDKLFVNERFIEVVGIHHINNHPFQLYQLFFDELRTHLCLPAGFEVEIIRFGTN